MAHQKPPATGKAVKLAPGLRSILAPNPSAMTYWGTNTYLLGERDVAVIDPGPPDEAHLQAILDALEGHQRISHILVTHSHIDHSPLAMVLAQFTGARVHGYGDSKAGRSEQMGKLGALGGGEGIDETFRPDELLSDGAVLEGRNWTLEAIHTPGHMGNHMCFAWAEGRAMFTGDLVMGWASSMVSPPDGDLTDFMGSLAILQRRPEEEIYYPGHGAAIDDPQARVAALIAHRQGREAQILHALSAGPITIPDLTAAIYTDTEPKLLPAAQRNVLAHLIDLTKKKRVTCEGALTNETVFMLT